MAGSRRHKVGVLGAGAWGTTVGKLLAERGHRVEIWCHEQEVALEINRRHSNGRYLVGVTLPANLKASSDLQSVLSKKEYLLVAIPTPFVVAIVKQMLAAVEIVEGKTLVGVLSKGFVPSSQGIRLITEAIEDYLPGIYKDNLVYISGPSHAEEVARGKITGLISASKNGTNAIRFRQLLSGKNLLVYSSLDVKGVQICAALKNVVAIAFGMLDALSELSDHFGDNTEALLMAAGLNEVQRLGLAMGATHAETFTSIAGVGDLEVTCRSEYGRNRRLGREIILTRVLEHFQDIEDLIANMGEIGYFAEGVVAAKHANELSRSLGVALPICCGVYRILNRQANAIQEVEAILKGISLNGTAHKDAPEGPAWPASALR